MATIAQIQQALAAAQGAGNAQDVAVLQQALQQAQPQADGPWQKYAAQQNGPWRKYATPPAPAAASGSDVNPYAQFVQDEPNPYAQFVQQQASPQVQRVSDLYHEALAAGNDVAAQHFAGWLQAHGGVAPASAGGNAAVQSIAQDVAAAHPQSGNQVEDAAIAFLHHFNNPTFGAVQGVVHGVDAAADAIPGVRGSVIARGLDSARSGIDSYLKNREANYQAFVPNGVGTTIGAGAVMGTAGQLAPEVLGGIGSRLAPVMSQAKQDALATAARYNIPLHLTQVANGRFTQALGAATRFLPFSGAAAADNAQRLAWNRALGSTIGQKADELTPAVLDAADATKSARYDALFGRNNIALDDQALQSLADISQKAKMGLSPDNQKIVNDQIDRYLNAAQDGSIPGPMYQSVRQDVLGDETGNPFVASRIRDVRHVMEDAADRSMGPQDAQELQDLNGLHKNIKTLRKALTQKAGADNTVTPANLWNLTQGRFGATPDMLNLAQLGQTVLKSPINDSGTAQRWLAYRTLGAGGLGAAGYLDPKDRQYLMPLAGALVAGPTLGRFMNSNTAARAMPYLGSSLFNGAATLARPLPLLLPSLQNNP